MFSVAEINITTIDARKKLKAKHEPYWRKISKGLTLGYRKGTNSTTWIGRKIVNSKYERYAIGIADDGKLIADGISVLDYNQALAALQHWAVTGETPKEAKTRELENRNTYSVQNAIDDYLSNYIDEKSPKESTLKATKQTINKNILPDLKTELVTEITTETIKNWRKNLVYKNLPDKLDESEKREVIRKRKSTANRILTILKAALNHAWSERTNIPTDVAWRKVKPYPKVDAAKVRNLSGKEPKRLINACEPDFRKLVHAALLTGMRYGEVINIKVKDFDPTSEKITATDTKNGKDRLIPLTKEGITFFTNETVGKAEKNLMFLRDDGEPWAKSHQSRRMEAACLKAEISPPATFHNLRDTYASILAMNGTAMKLIADFLGHSDTRITEKHYAHFQDNFKTETLKKNLPNFIEIEKSDIETT